MSEPHAAVWAAARPYLRARKNDVHVPLSYACAERLLEHHPEADADVVLLAILLHDVGWALVDEDAIYREAFGPDMMRSEVRIAHEKEGARLARAILGDLGYPEALVEEVAEIVDGHDTRSEALSRNDELVKDADRLWRFSVTGVGVVCDWFGLTPGEYADRLARQVDQCFTAEAREIAHRELIATRVALKVDLLADLPRAVGEDVYARIYELAEPYWRTRAGEIHMPESYGFARELLAAHPDAEAEIVLPAILLHDVGYALVPEETHRQGLAGGKNGWQPDVTRIHEQLGAKLAGDLLERIGYDPERTRRIQEIVDGHDTRTAALDLEDAIVKDADKLWRFSPSAAEICPEWFDTSRSEYLEWLASRLDEWLITDTARRRAQTLLDESRAAAR